MLDEDVKNLIHSLCNALEQRNYGEFENMIQDNLTVINDRQQGRQVIQDVLSAIAPVACPKVIEILLNCGVNFNSSDIKHFISDSQYNKLFGCSIECEGYGISYTLTLSLVRIMLQNSDLLEEPMSKNIIGEQNEHMLHSIVHSIYENLNSRNSNFRRNECHIDRENYKRYLSLLFTSIVLMLPLPLEQEHCSNSINNRTSSHENIIGLLIDFILMYREYDLDHPYIQGFYNNLQKILKLTLSGDHTLSQKIKELISYINLTKLDADELEKMVGKIKQEIRSQGDTLAEKCISDTGNLIIENLPIILLDKKREKLLPYRDSLKRKILIRLYDTKIGNVNKTFEIYNVYAFEQVLNKFDSEGLDSLMKAIFGNAFEKLISSVLLDMHCAVDYINGSTDSIIKKLENIALDFLSLKESLEDNPAEALDDICYLSETDTEGAVQQLFDQTIRLK